MKLTMNLQKIFDGIISEKTHFILSIITFIIIFMSHLQIQTLQTANVPT